MEMGLVGIVKFVAALVFVLALMGGLSFALKRMGYGNPALAVGRQRRLKLAEVLPIDTRHKAVILECDGEQHLVILGTAGDTVVKNNLSKQAVSHESVIKDAA